MSRQAIEAGAQNQRTTRSLAGGILLSIIILASPLCSTSCKWISCQFANEIQTGELTYTRTIFILFDQTASLGKLGKAAGAMKPAPTICAPEDNHFTCVIKRIVKKDVIANLQPGDYVECYQIGSDNKTYNADSYRVFGDEVLAPKVRANIANGGITEQRLNGDCPGEVKARKDLEDQWTSFKDAKEKWSGKLEAARPPENQCCSAYLQTIHDLGERLQKQPGKKWLVVVGDLLEEPGLTKWKDVSRADNPQFPDLQPPAPANNERDTFNNVEVLLLWPSGVQPTALRLRLEEYWKSYFKARGNDQIKIALNNTPSPLASGQSRVPQLNQKAKK